MIIEMEITLRCNAKCPACSRHCHYGLYDEDSDVTSEQVNRFCDEVIAHGGVDLLTIMGGEPTLHPELKSIMSAVVNMKDEGHIKRCQVVTNGKIITPRMAGMNVVTYPEEAQIRHVNHRCMFVSPRDTGQQLKHCPVARDCGVSWGAYGWWPCGAGGAICRLFGFTQYQRETMPSGIYVDGGTADFPGDILMCVNCQAKAMKYMYCKDYGDIRSVSFREAMRKFDAKELWRY